LVDQYKKGGQSKRDAISLLLDTIHVRLKALTVQAPDYDSLMIVQASRRLYQNEGIDADAALVISRRFAKAYQDLGDHEKIREIKKEVLQYNRMLKFYGVRDHQVKNTHLSARKAMFLIVIRCLEVAMLAIFVAPIIIMFSPLFLLTKKVSRGKAAEALAGSKVKISGKDVVSTWKLLTALVVTPVLWAFYTVIFTYLVFGFLLVLRTLRL
jgi:glycerol-3-phosphate O-acyltransferase/dihydroxyacetone phosphate acyltransferase